MTKPQCCSCLQRKQGFRMRLAIELLALHMFKSICSRKSVCVSICGRPRKWNPTTRPILASTRSNCVRWEKGQANALGSHRLNPACSHRSVCVSLRCMRQVGTQVEPSTEPTIASCVYKGQLSEGRKGLQTLWFHTGSILFAATNLSVSLFGACGRLARKWSHQQNQL